MKMGCVDCGCHECHHGEKAGRIDFGDSATNMFVNMANDAWEDLFIEKAKVHWEKVHGKQMNEMAKAAVQASFDYHMNMMGSEKRKAETIKKMNSFME
jgi:predicted secreted Zn-dependent protease